MPEITIDVEIWCSCGNGLCNQSVDSSRMGRGSAITVEPCEKCLEAEHEKGHGAGYDDAIAESEINDSKTI